MDIVIKIILVILASFWIKLILKFVKNVLITVLSVILFSSVYNVRLGIKQRLLKLLDKMLLLVLKFVGMELSMNKNVMMEILYLGMDVLVLVIFKLDGLASMVHLDTKAIAINLSQMQQSSQVWVS
jgi:hypothetical protein